MACAWWTAVVKLVSCCDVVTHMQPAILVPESSNISVYVMSFMPSERLRALSASDEMLGY
jgi:hypothetical protein